jgi:hypothetical protein
MRFRVEIVLLCSLLVSMATGCTNHIGKATIFSTRNVEMSQPHERLPRASESDHRFWIAFIPLGAPPSGMQAAIDLVDDQNADYLTNIEVTEGGWSLLAISHGWVTVEADPWRRSGVAPPRESR